MRIPAVFILLGLTAGAQTEKNYFDLLKAKHSIYSVHVKFENADPLGLVEYAKDFLNNANQIWCVFDIDYTHDDGRLVPALNLAEKYGIKIVYSNKAFEVWLISHFKTFKTKMPIDNYSGVLTACLNDIGYSNAYDKTDKSLLQKYFIPNYKAAIDNAKIVYQRYVKQHNEECGSNSKMPIWEWDASTTVFKLVDLLCLFLTFQEVKFYRRYHQTLNQKVHSKSVEARQRSNATEHRLPGRPVYG